MKNTVALIKDTTPPTEAIFSLTLENLNKKDLIFLRDLFGLCGGSTIDSPNGVASRVYSIITPIVGSRGGNPRSVTVKCGDLIDVSNYFEIPY